MASITTAAAQAMLTALGTTLGTSPNLIPYAGTAPASVRAALSSDTVLGTLPCAATPFSGYSDDGTANEVATLGSVTPATASNSGTAAFWRLLTSGGTPHVQGTIGTSGAELNMNTVAITAGSTLSVTAGSIKLPYGP